MYGEDFHPIMKMAQNCVDLQAIVDGMEKAEISHILDANRAWEGVAQYVEPKLKAIDIDMTHGFSKDLKSFLEQLSNQDQDLPDDYENH